MRTDRPAASRAGAGTGPDPRDADDGEHPVAVRHRRGCAIPSAGRSSDGGAHCPDRIDATAGFQPHAPIRLRLLWTVAGFGTLALAACLFAPLVGSTRIHLGAVFDRSIPYRRQPRRADLLRGAPAAGDRGGARRQRPGARRASCFRRCCATRWRRPTRSASRRGRRSAP